MPVRGIYRLTLAALSILVLGCGGGDDGGGAGPAPPSVATTASVALAWDPVTANDLAGYRVYQSTAGGSLGTMIRDTGSPSTTTFTAGNLQKGTTYFFVVKAYDTVGNESVASNQISKLVQ